MILTGASSRGEEVVLTHYANPRRAVLEWMCAEDIPYFTRAFVNRD